jgi:hypothetical protein
MIDDDLRLPVGSGFELEESDVDFDDDIAWHDDPAVDLEAPDDLRRAKMRLHEDAWFANEPFLRDEDMLTPADLADTMRARDEQLRGYYQRYCSLLEDVRPRRVSAEDLRPMLDWDRACYFEDACAGAGAEPCGPELEALGFALHRGDPTFFERLRKLGATPATVRQANEILLPKDVDVEAAPVRPSRTVCPAQRRTHARPRGRRSAPGRRVVSGSAGGGSSGDPAEDEPGERPRRDRHDVAVAAGGAR